MPLMTGAPAGGASPELVPPTVDGAGEQLLAGATLAGDEDRQVRRRDALNRLQYSAHRLRARDDPLEALVLHEVVDAHHVRMADL